MTIEKIEKGQKLIDRMNVGDKKSLKEIYGEEWKSITSPKSFGKTFKSAVNDNLLKNIIHIGIRNAGRCDEYEKI